MARVSVLAPREVGGLQLPAMVEAMVAAVGSDLLLLLNGKTASSLLARAERMAMQLDPDTASTHQDIVCRAMVFLAGYKIYLTVSSERLLSRLLDHLKTCLGSPHAQFVGPADEWSHQQGAQYCRVGRFVNSLQRALDSRRHTRLGARTRLAATPGALVWTFALGSRGGHDCFQLGLGGRVQPISQTISKRGIKRGLGNGRLVQPL